MHRVSIPSQVICSPAVARCRTPACSVARPSLHSQRIAPFQPAARWLQKARQFIGHRQASPSRRQAAAVAAAAKTAAAPHIQLATAKIPSDVNLPAFTSSLYQWAATLTSSGQNMPFALPIRADKLDDGFELSLLSMQFGMPVNVGEIVATVEKIEGTGNVLFVRFYEGGGSSLMVNKDLSGTVRLKALLGGLVDVPLIMNTMRDAIRRAVISSR